MLAQADAVDLVVLRHIRQDHHVTGLQAGDDLDGVDRAAAQPDVDPDGRVAARLELEDPDRAVGLAVGRAAHVDHVIEPLDLDHAIHAEVRPRARRQLPLERHIHPDGARRRRRIDPYYAAGDDSVSRVDRRRLAERDVPDLRLRHAQHGLEAAWLDDLGQRGARVGPHADLERQLLDDADGARADRHGLDLLLAELDDPAQPLDLLLLGLDLRGLRAREHLEALLLDLELALGFHRGVPGAGQLVLRAEAPLGQLLLRLVLPHRLVVLRLGRGDGRLLAQALGLEARAQVDQLELRRVELPVRLQRLELDVRVGQPQEDRVLVHLRAGLDQLLLHAALRHRRDPADLLGHERAGAANLPQ